MTHPPDRPDQRLAAQTRSPGPPPQSNVFNVIYIVGPKGGLFLYSPTAGPNNLIASLAPAGTTVDQFGNPVLAAQFAEYNFAAGEAVGLTDTALQTYVLSGGSWISGGMSVSFLFGTTRLGLGGNNGIFSTSSNGFSQGVSGNPEVVHQFTSGFPPGWTGTISYWLDNEGVTPRVGIDWHITIATTTVVANNTDMLNAVGSSYHFTDNKFAFGQINGGGLTGSQFAPIRISSTGELFYDGPAFTASGAAFWYGGSTYSVGV